MMMDIIRQNPCPHFTRRSVRQTVYAQTARRRLGLPRGDATNLTPIFARAAKGLNKSLKTFMIEVPEEEWVRSSITFRATLNGAYEWPQALQEAWKGDVPSENYLSEVATRLLEMIRQGEIDSDQITEDALSSKVGLKVWHYSIDKYLEEIVNKTGSGLRWKAEGWYRDRKFQIELMPAINASPKSVSWLTSSVELKFSHYTRTDVEQAAKRLHELILKGTPNGNEPLYLLSISSYQEFRQFFPGEGDPRIKELVEFLEAMPLNPSVRLTYDFRDYARRWFISVTPKVDWASSLSAISDEISQPGLQERLGISTDAAKLLRWVERLPVDKLVGRLTPVVEEDCEKRIGIKCPWDSKNFPTYIQLLIEEINEKTDYDLKALPWHNYAYVYTRLLVGRKKTDLDDILRRLQWLGLQNGVPLDIATAETVLIGLISPRPNDTPEPDHVLLNMDMDNEHASEHPASAAIAQAQADRQIM